MILKLNNGLVTDGEIDVSRPEPLIYEPSAAGMQPVGVEFVGSADPWLSHHSSPNRYGLPAHRELNVWALRENTQGAFVDWNNEASCERQ